MRHQNQSMQWCQYLISLESILKETTVELKDIDLNLLVVFNQLLMERKVSKVAENLGLGQPAVSNAQAVRR